MEKKFVEPELKIIYFIEDDIITNSVGSPDPGLDDDDENDDF